MISLFPPRSRLFPVLLAALFCLSCTVRAAVVTATFNAASDVPVTASTYTAAGNSINLTLNFARTLAGLNPDMTFCYVSGTATDSSEHGRTMWARVKGRTENDIMKLPFRKAYMFRPGYMHPTPGLRNANKLYKLLGWLYPIVRALSNKYASTLAELGQSMIRSATMGYEKPVLEVPDIIALAHR